MPHTTSSTLFGSAARRVSASATAWLICGLFVSGCVTQKSDKPDVGPQPKDSKPGVMWLGVNAPSDTNGNGYSDSLLVTVYLFADNGYVRSISLPGTYHFQLLAKGGKVVREWDAASPGPKVAPIKSGVGSGCLIALSMLEAGGSDVFTYQSVDLVGTFKTVDGVEVRSTPNAVLIGKPNSNN
jgi:hypothetical protein